MPNLGQIWRFLEQCDLGIWQMTLKNNRAPLLCYFKLCASFCSHWWIQTGVTVRKRPIWVKFDNFFYLCDIDLWPWPFAWMSLLSLVITPGNFMMILWGEHSQKDVTDRQTDRQTENTIHRAAWSQLKRCDRQTDGQTENTICRAAWSQLKTIGHIFYATSSFVHHLVPIGEFKLELQSGNAQSGSNSMIFRAVWPWNLTDDLEKQ